MATTKKKAKPASVPSRYQLFIDGTLDVSELDDEELIRGQIKDKNGEFRGRPPRAIPREFHTAVVRELLHRAEGRLKGHLNLAMDTFVEIAANKRAPAIARIQAAQYLWERIAGKIPDKQIVEASIKKWEADLGGLLVDVEDDPKTKEK